MITDGRRGRRRARQGVRDEAGRHAGRRCRTRPAASSSTATRRSTAPGAPVDETVALAADGTAETSSVHRHRRHVVQGATTTATRTTRRARGACEPLPVVGLPPCPAGSFKVTLQANGDAVIVVRPVPGAERQQLRRQRRRLGQPRAHTFKDLTTATTPGSSVKPERDGRARLQHRLHHGDDGLGGGPVRLRLARPVRRRRRRQRTGTLDADRHDVGHVAREEPEQARLLRQRVADRRRRRRGTERRRTCWSTRRRR